MTHEAYVTVLVAFTSGKLCAANLRVLLGDFNVGRDIYHFLASRSPVHFLCVLCLIHNTQYFLMSPPNNVTNFTLQCRTLHPRSFTPPRKMDQNSFPLPNFAAMAAATAEKLIAPELTLTFVLPSFRQFFGR